MAQGITGYKDYSGSNGYKYRVNYSETYDIETNTSTMAVTSVQIMGTWYYGGVFYLDGYVSFDGTNAVKVSSSTGGSSANVSSLNQWFTFSNSSGSVQITHKSDGSQSTSMTLNLAAFTVSGATGGRVTDSGTAIQLTTIPRASSATYSGTTLGSSMAINISRAASSFTHTVTLTFGSYSTQKTGVGTSTSLGMPLEWCNAIPSAVDGKGTLTVVTYDGSTQIGSKSYTVTLTVPSSVVPTISVAYEGVRLFQELYVQGKSSVKFTITADGVYGSTIKSYYTSGAGYSSANKTATIGALNTTGDTTFTCTVTDSRGRTASHTFTIAVIAYSKPTLTVDACYRCTLDGTASQDGTYLLVRATFSCSSVNGKNAINGNVSYKKTSDTSYTRTTDIISATNKVVFGGNISAQNSYMVKFTAKDSVGESAEAVQVITSSANYLITAKLGKIAIGGYVDDSLSDGLQVIGDDIYLNGVSTNVPIYSNYYKSSSTAVSSSSPLTVLEVTQEFAGGNYLVSVAPHLVTINTTAGQYMANVYVDGVNTADVFSCAYSGPSNGYAVGGGMVFANVPKGNHTVKVIISTSRSDKTATIYPYDHIKTCICRV